MTTKKVKAILLRGVYTNYKALLIPSGDGIVIKPLAESEDAKVETDLVIYIHDA